MLNQEQALEEKWMHIMEEEIESTIKIITRGFLERMELQEEVLKKEFSLELRLASLSFQNLLTPLSLCESFQKL